MRYKKFEDHIVAIMETGESIIEGLTELCEKEQIGHGMVTGIGGTKYLRLGVWDRFENCYKYIEKDQGSMEILSLKGNISRKDGVPNLHLHVTASDDSFNASRITALRIGLRIYSKTESLIARLAYWN